jgi:c-di-GMP-binding flagellar brake protein YcgR
MKNGTSEREDRMGNELLGEVTDNGWWSVDAQAILDKLHGVEALIVIAIICAVVALRMVLRSTSSLEAGKGSGVSETMPLTAQGPIFVGSKAKLSLVGEPQPVSFDGMLESIDPRMLGVRMPHEASARIRIGATAEVTVTSPSAAYRFSASVRDRRRAGETLMVLFDRPQWVERLQRRSNYRVRADQAATISRVDSASPSGALYRAVVQNLSGTGMLVCVPFRPPDGSILRVRMSIEPLAGTSYEVRVVRSCPARLPHSGMWAAGCELLWMDETAQARLTRACHELERGSKAKAV